ncbi:ATP-dependent DNA helicase PIF1-like protein [Tanacetum coccineum]
MGTRCGGRDCGSQKKEDEDEPTWIEIPEDFIINVAESPIEQIINHLPWRLRDVAVYYHFAISTFLVKIVIRSSAFILEYLLQLPIRYMEITYTGGHYPMTQKYAFEALDKTLRDILGYKNPEKRNVIFGGVTVLLGGPRCEGRDCGSQKKEDEDEATWIEIPEDFIINAAESPIEQIVKETFPDFTTRKSDGAYLKERAILTPRNDDVDAINAYMFGKLPGPMTYNRADEVCKALTDVLDQQHLYPAEFLSTLNFPGMPPHAIKLKKELPIMLL